MTSDQVPAVPVTAAHPPQPATATALAKTEAPGLPPRLPDSEPISEAASKKRRGRPRAFPAAWIAILRHTFPEAATDRQLLEHAWAIHAADALKLCGPSKGVDERLTWLWSEKKCRIGIMARLGRTARDWKESFLCCAIYWDTYPVEEVDARVYKKLLPIALELCRIRPRARDAQACIDAIESEGETAGERIRESG